MGTDVTPQSGPIMLRAAISRAEWTALRKIALDRNMSTAEAVALALRSTYSLGPVAS